MCVTQLVAFLVDTDMKLLLVEGLIAFLTTATKEAILTYVQEEKQRGVLLVMSCYNGHFHENACL